MSEDEDDGVLDMCDREEAEVEPSAPMTTSSQDGVANPVLELTFELPQKQTGEEEMRLRAANNIAEEIARLKRLIASAEAARAAKQVKQDSVPQKVTHLSHSLRNPSTQATQNVIPVSPPEPPVVTMRKVKRRGSQSQLSDASSIPRLRSRIEEDFDSSDSGGDESSYHSDISMRSDTMTGYHAVPYPKASATH